MGPTSIHPTRQPAHKGERHITTAPPLPSSHRVGAFSLPISHRVGLPVSPAFPFLAGEATGEAAAPEPMDGIEGLLARDFGVRPPGKGAPMAGGASRPAAGSAAGPAAWSNPGRSAPASSAAPSYDDLFGAPAPAASFDSLFDSFNGPTSSSSSAARAKTAPSSAPVFDDDIFDAVPGLRPSSNSSARYDDGVFGAAAPAYDDVFAAGTRSAPPPAYDDDDDLLGGFGSAPRAEEKKRPVVVDDGDDLLGGFGRKPAPVEEEATGGAGFDDLIPGFAGSSPPRSR